MREKLTADEVRNLEEDDYVVVELHDDEYWHAAEGRVREVYEYDGGDVSVRLNGGRLEVPADARKRWHFYGSAQGARKLRVDSVYKR